MTEELKDVAGTEGTDPVATKEPKDVAKEPVTITVVNPDAEQLAAILAATQEGFESPVHVVAEEFKFKKSVDKLTGIETIREPVVIPLPLPTVEGIVAILENEDGKGITMLLDAMRGVVNSAARDILYKDTSLNAETFPVEQLDWEFIARLPKPQRNGGGVAKEVWEAFTVDYIAVMPEATGKTEEAVTNGAKLLAGKFTSCRTNKKAIRLLTDQLSIYMEATEQADKFAPCIEFLLDKSEMLLNVTDEDLLANL